MNCLHTRGVQRLGPAKNRIIYVCCSFRPNTLIFWGVINIKDYDDLVVDYSYYDNQSL